MKRVTVCAKVLLVSGLSSLAVLGCAKNAVTTSAPADAQTIQMIRESLTKADPKVAVGVVESVLENEPYAAVGDIPVQNFKEGDPITFIDANRQPIANGVVRAIASDSLHVRIVDTLIKGRKVQKGDLAVRFSK